MILMLTNSRKEGHKMSYDLLAERIHYLVGDKSILDNITDMPSLPVFSDSMMEFLNDLSKELLREKDAKQYADIMSYAFWIRKSSLEKEKKKHADYADRIGRGVALHIAPSNVPINFAVSMTSALLAGNACIIRVSNKEFEQVDIVCRCMNRLLEDKWEKIRGYFCIIRYEHNDEITQMLSDKCDIRIIWGGNETIRRIRAAKLPPRAIEMAFADRYSLLLIDSNSYMGMDSKDIARKFFTDTFYTDQSACSSPRIVVWFGDKCSEAKEVFWNAISDIVKKDYEMPPVMVVNKLDALCRLAADVRLTDVEPVRAGHDNVIFRVKVNNVSSDMMEYKEGGGYFFEFDADKPEDILKLLSKKCQTISVCGIDKEAVKKFVIDKGVKGVDRIVNIGDTMELSFRWDGYDMIDTMSRIVE